MTREAHAVRDLDAAYPEMITWGKGMDVEALPDANVALSGGDQPLGGSKILRCRDLQIVLAAFNHHRSHTRRFGDRGVIREGKANGGAVGSEDRVEVKALGCLRPPQGRTVDCFPDEPIFSPFYRVAEWQAGDHRHRPVEPVEDPRDQLRIGKWASPVVNQHAFRTIGCQCLEPEPNRILTGSPARDRRDHAQTGDGAVEGGPVLG